MEQTLWTMPGASDRYHVAREELLKAEMDLQKHVEQVAALRRELPPGPTVPDYEFFDGANRCRLSDFFADGKPYLVVYHVMYWRDDEEFCPMCSMWVDGWNGVADHVAQRTNMIATTLAAVDKVQAWAQRRGWRRIRFLADADDSFARDTMAQDTDGEPVSTVLVFEKTSDGIRHRYTAHAEGRPGVIRGIDQLCTTWHIEDLLPSGRGDWNAGNDYVK